MLVRYKHKERLRGGERGEEEFTVKKTSASPNRLKEISLLLLSSLSESPAYPRSSRRWCCTDCGRKGRSAPWTTPWRNTWRTSPSRTPWGGRGTRSWNMSQMVWYFWTAGRFRSARRPSPCAGWPASSQVLLLDYQMSCGEHYKIKKLVIWTYFDLIKWIRI